VRKRFGIVFFLLWLAAAFVAGWLYFKAIRPTRFLGVVEAREHQVSSVEPGIISQLSVNIGDRVKAGQELARIYSVDAQGIDVLQAMADLMRVENAFRDEIAELEAMKAEVEGLNVQISRLKRAGVRGVVPSQNLADLVIRRDTLQAHIRERMKLLGELESEYFADQPQVDTQESAGKGSAEASALERYRERLRSLRRRLLDYERRLSSERISSPCDGRVIAVYARAGDVIDAFQPFLAVVEDSPSYMEAYVPERASLTLAEGERVTVSSMRSGVKPTGGTVRFVHREVSPLPERLVVGRTHPWVRRVYIELDCPHELLPGEKVRVRIVPERTGLSGHLSCSADAAEQKSPAALGGGPDNPEFKEVYLPDRLRMRTRFEPSGLVWLEDIKRFLVISDDTGCKSENDHAPWLFLMDADGRVEPEPVKLDGIDEINDLEAVADKGDGIIYLLSSQSLNKKGRRSASRQYLLEVERRGRQFTVSRRIRLFSLLTRSYGADELAALGLTRASSDGKLVLDIEGMAYRDGCLYLGLKEPVGEEGAVIWRLTDPDRAFEGPKLASGQVSNFAQVDLGKQGGSPVGISGMAFDEDGRLLILSTVAGASGSEQAGGCHIVDDFHQGKVKARSLFSFPRYKPEGICLVGPGRFRIVFDTDCGCLSERDIGASPGAKLPPFVDFDLRSEKK